MATSVNTNPSTLLPLGKGIHTHPEFMPIIAEFGNKSSVAFIYCL